MDLTGYTRDVSKFKPLTPEEEKSLFEAYIASGKKDTKIRNQIATANQRLVMLYATKATKQRQWHSIQQDCIQEGSLGVLRAIDKFQPGRQLRFSTYCRFWIQAHILMFMKNHASIVNTGAGRSGQHIGEIHQDASLDKPVFGQDEDDSTETWVEQIASEEDIESNAIEDQHMLLLEEEIQKLSPFERDLYQRRIRGDQSLETVGEAVGMGRESVRKYLNVALKRLEGGVKSKVRQAA